MYSQINRKSESQVIICVWLKTVPSIIQVSFAKFLWCINDEFSNTKSFQGVCLVLRPWNTPNVRWKGADLAQAEHSNVNKPTIINSTSSFCDWTSIYPPCSGLYSKHGRSLVKQRWDVVIKNKLHSIHCNFFFSDVNQTFRPECIVCLHLIHSLWFSIYRISNFLLLKVECLKLGKNSLDIKKCIMFAKKWFCTLVQACDLHCQSLLLQA